MKTKREITVRVNGTITEENKREFHNRLAKMIINKFGADLVESALKYMEKESANKKI